MQAHVQQMEFLTRCEDQDVPTSTVAVSHAHEHSAGKPFQYQLRFYSVLPPPSVQETNKCSITLMLLFNLKGSVADSAIKYCDT
jgi:hypothetical protein